MIRSTRIPSILNKVCDETIESCLLITAEGELLGVSHHTPSDSTASTTLPHHPSDLTSLLADIASQYQQLGEDYYSSQQQPHNSMNCLILELEERVVGIAACAGIDCLVVGLGPSDAPLGLLRARLQALATYVQESLSSLTAASGS